MVTNVADILFDNAADIQQGVVVFDGVNAGTSLYTSPSSFQAGLNGLSWSLEDYTNMGSAIVRAAGIAWRCVETIFEADDVVPSS